MPINLLFQLQTTISGVSDVLTLAAYLFIALQCKLSAKGLWTLSIASLLDIAPQIHANFGSEITETLW